MNFPSLKKSTFSKTVCTSVTQEEKKQLGQMLDAIMKRIWSSIRISDHVCIWSMVRLLNYNLSRRFDLHDTEDCPTQSMQQQQEELEETDSPNKSLGGHTRSGGVRGASRSYCDKCEVFGHETSTCDVADSYWWYLFTFTTKPERYWPDADQCASQQFPKN